MEARLDISPRIDYSDVTDVVAKHGFYKESFSDYIGTILLTENRDAQSNSEIDKALVAVVQELLNHPKVDCVMLSLDADAAYTGEPIEMSESEMLADLSQHCGFCVASPRYLQEVAEYHRPRTALENATSALASVKSQIRGHLSAGRLLHPAVEELAWAEFEPLLLAKFASVFGETAAWSGDDILPALSDTGSSLVIYQQLMERLDAPALHLAQGRWFEANAWRCVVPPVGATTAPVLQQVITTANAQVEYGPFALTHEPNGYGGTVTVMMGGNHVANLVRRMDTGRFDVCPLVQAVPDMSETDSYLLDLFRQTISSPVGWGWLRPTNND